MSAPIQGSDRPDDPLLYAPRRVREAPPTQGTPRTHDIAMLTGAPPMAPDADGFTSSPPMAPGLGGFNIEPPPTRPFQGDVAIKELRRRLSVDPSLVPEPPLQPRQRPALSWLGALSLVMLAAIGAVGLALLVLPVGDFTGAALKGERSFAGASVPLLDDLTRPSTPLPRLVVESQRAFANEPMPLGVALNGASGGETLILVGLAAGTKLSVGTPRGSTGWQVSARELDGTFAYAPKDFVGVMDAAIELRSATDRLMDSQVVRLEWIWKKPDMAAAVAPRREPLAPAPPAPSLDPDELATLIKRGHDFLKAGDIPSARLVLRRAANAGSAQAALAIGGTHDGMLLAELGVLGFAADAAQARTWYQRALELGSPEASRRLDRLADVTR
jgi:hypothetical protein